ncbi:universal stress protein [Arthrobacter agilis]|uniref:universal stress protein n=1 Tax=Arthrobacter agilis TaxID=37921 RepID=UPI0023668805|nr:universal stress protein [Arthrobacter agilis]WDF31857.1 universal stress protein [Arthrobacter agilis]
MNAPSPSSHRVIVVGVDGSPSSVAALQLAASLVPLAGDAIDAVTAWQYPLVFGVHTPMDWNYEELGGQALDQALLEAFPDRYPCTIKRRLLNGSPAQTLIEESRDASMVVIGSRGHGGFSGLLLGSVSSTVAERAQCPVLVSHGALQLPGADLADNSESARATGTVAAPVEALA